MKRTVLIVIALSLACVAALAQAPVAVTDPKQIVSHQKDDLLTYPVEKLLTTRAVGESTWSPDGKQIAFISNISGRRNLWLVPAEGGWPVQLTVSDQRQTSPAWSPNGKWIAYASDKNGNEQWDIFVVSVASGEVFNLSNTPAVSEEAPAWSPDGRYLAWQAKPQSGSTYEIEIFDMLFRRRRALTANTPKNLINVEPRWSPAGKSISYTQLRADDKDSDIYVADATTGNSINLTAHQGEQRYSAGAWSPDGKKLLITSNALNGSENVGLLEIATKHIQWLTQAKWESQAGSFSPDGRSLTWTTNTEGDQDIFLYTLATKHAEALALHVGVNALAGSATAFSDDGTRLLYYHNGPEAPNDLWTYTLLNKRSRQITHSLVAGVKSDDMVAPTLMHYPSADGKFTISAWVYTPFNQIKNGQIPAIVYVHGGPQAQFMNSFNPAVQFLVNQGYFVIAPNYRGSTGYGKEFMDANRFDMGGGDLQDVLAASAWIAKTAYVDSKKLVIMGGSYGGYMTMMALTKSPETWAAGVAIVPFVNWFTEVQQEDPLLQQYDLATMGDPEKSKSLWQERSPINFIDHVKAPLLLLAGGNDPRCPKEEAQQVADAIKKNGGKVEFKIYDNEGHGFARIENQIDAWGRVGGFLKFNVPAPGCNLSGCEVQ
jgi:dipeptidyl aminopeptidase/acylaminoacyl peptidase